MTHINVFCSNLRRDMKDEGGDLTPSDETSWQLSFDITYKGNVPEIEALHKAVHDLLSSCCNKDGSPKEQL